MANKPNIRFKGFTDDWEQRKLGDSLLLLKDGTHGTHADANEGPLLLSAKNIKDGTIKWDDTDRRISLEEYEKIHSKFNLKSGDVLLTIVGSIGETAILQDSESLTFQRSVAFLRPQNDITSEFLYSEIQSEHFQKELESRKSTSAQPGIYLGDLAEIPLYFPSVIDEQKKIGQYFSTLDHLITLHQRKCDETKKLKKFMLQKMFPKNGEKNPEIRFAGFTDDWEQRKLGEIIDAYNEKKPKNIDLPVLTSSRQGIQKQEEHFGSEQKHDTKDYNVIPMGYCTYRNRSDDKTFTFNINHSVKRGIVSKFYPVFSINNGNAKFITEFLNTNLEIKNRLAVLAVGTSQVVLSFANLKELKLCVPSKLEQDKIGNYIDTLDHLITLHQRKCDKLKLIKKFMLQNMFPKKG